MDSTENQKPNLLITLREWTRAKKVFYLLFLFTLFNVAGISARYFHFIIPLNTLVTLIALIICFPVLKSPFHNRYFIISFFFLASFLILGFVGPQCVIDYSLVRMSFKLITSFFIVPWIGLHVVEKKDLEIYFKTLIYFMLIAAIFTLIQYFFYGHFKTILMAIHNRPAAFWINPNQGSFMLMCLFFISLAQHKSPTIFLRVTQLLVLIAIALTFSRSAIFLTVIGLLLYLLYRNDKKLWLQFSLGIMLVSIFLFSIKSTFNENQKGRISSFVQASQGKEIKSNTRIYIWKSSFEFIVDRNVFTGAGHQAMNNIVLFDGKWVGPHNFYLWIWGNSGIFVLFIFCFWLGYILYKAFQVADVLSRLVAIILSFSFIGYSFTDHSFLLHQGTGIILFFILFFIVNSPSISNTLENN